ncbi:MAG: DUF1450 domain-containing protein [Alicyclobacillus sp.]|nr:DUF1450 domain-containing protein [Alicyclobacillus sp.]
MDEAQGGVELEVCLQNPGAQVAARVAAHLPGRVCVRHYDCLDQCALCVRAAFAWLHGACWQAASDEALYTQLLHTVNRVLAPSGPTPSPASGHSDTALASPRKPRPGTGKAWGHPR